jgi:hypothetical protein
MSIDQSIALTAGQYKWGRVLTTWSGQIWTDYRTRSTKAIVTPSGHDGVQISPDDRDPSATDPIVSWDDWARLVDDGKIAPDNPPLGMIADILDHVYGGQAQVASAHLASAIAACKLACLTLDGMDRPGKDHCTGIANLLDDIATASIGCPW